MTKYSGDIRTRIRDTIGYAWEVDGDDVSTVSVKDDYDDVVYVPLYLPGDVRTGDLPEMPFIEMTMVNAPHTTLNVGGDVDFVETYFDFNIYYVSQDGISATTFGRTVADKIVQLLDTYKLSVTSSYFIDVLNSGREIIEDYSGSPVFHNVVEVRAINYQS
jgi:hypothetical protein